MKNKADLLTKEIKNLQKSLDNATNERNKHILIDYQSNKAHYEMRGFKPYTVKMFVPKENVVNLTKKVKKNVKKTKKKN